MIGKAAELLKPRAQYMLAAASSWLAGCLHLA
jgi:hypothetical protein